MPGKTRKFSLALAVLLIAAAPAFAADPQPGDASSFAAGMQAVASGDLFRAAIIFNALLQSHPHAPDAYLGLAEVQGRSGHPDEADKWLARGIAANPKDASLLRARARIALAQRRFSDAAGFLSKASLLAPADADLHYDYASALAAADRRDEALKELAQAQSLGPQNPLPSFQAAQLLAEKGATADALAMLDAALKIKPDFEAAQMARGDILLRAGENEEAVVAYRDFLSRNPKSVLALTGLGVACRALGRDAEAMAAFRSIIALDPDNIVALGALAWMSADRKENLPQAADWIKHALAKAGDDAELHDTLGWIYRQSGKPLLARDELRQGLKLKPSAGLYYHLGMVAIDLGKQEDAARLFQHALLLQPWRADAQTALWALAGDSKVMRD